MERKEGVEVESGEPVNIDFMRMIDGNEVLDLLMAVFFKGVLSFEGIGFIGVSFGINEFPGCEMFGKARLAIVVLPQPVVETIGNSLVEFLVSGREDDVNEELIA